MIYKVNLQLFQDDATGEYGLAPQNSIDREFNSFWTHQGIFHDVFEHYFEDNHKYFKREYSFNIGGEVAAMGHYAYYMNRFNFSKRPLSPNSMYSMEENIIDSTFSEMQEGIEEGYARFGSELLCRVPRTKVDNYTLDNIIYEHFAKIKNCRITNGEYRDYAKNYKKSVTLTKLRNLYTWGYKRAEMIAPRNIHNYDVMRGFLDSWEEFCSYNKPEDLFQWLRGVEITISTGEKMKWKAEWTTREGQKIKGNSKYIEELSLDLNEY